MFKDNVNALRSDTVFMITIVDSLSLELVSGYEGMTNKSLLYSVTRVTVASNIYIYIYIYMKMIANSLIEI